MGGLRKPKNKLTKTKRDAGKDRSACCKSESEIDGDLNGRVMRAIAINYLSDGWGKESRPPVRAITTTTTCLLLSGNRRKLSLK